MSDIARAKARRLAMLAEDIKSASAESQDAEIKANLAFALAHVQRAEARMLAYVAIEEEARA